MRTKFQKGIMGLVAASLMITMFVSPMGNKASASQDVKKVVIDAGHGGWHNGAQGNGLKEKDVALTIAKKIDSYLKEDYIVDTKMTRASDIYLTLGERTTIANSWGADLFLSVHINASESGLLNGYEDFTYNGGTSTMRNAEKLIQQSIHNEIKPVIGNYSVANRGMKQANFHVLRETNMPAILTETLFIDNSNDSILLKDSSFLNNIAKAHAKGIAKALNLPKHSDVNVVESATYVTTANLNMRTKAGLGNPVIKTIKNGTEIKIENAVRVGNITWGYGKANGKSGWLSMDYMKLTAVNYVTSANLNIRENAGTKYKILTNAKKGTEVTITKTMKVGNDTWGYGSANGKSGWMSMAYLKKR